jgi:hypothetical protein
MMLKSFADTRFTLVHVAATRLLLPQSDLRDIEGLDDFSAADVPPGGVGWLRVGRHAYPVYCMTEDFSLTDIVPASRRMCVLLAHADGPFGLLCDQVDMLEAQVALHPLPQCMRIVGSPVEALAMQADGLACVSSAQRLAALISRQTPQPVEAAV